EEQERVTAACLPQDQLDREGEQETEGEHQRHPLDRVREEIERDEVPGKHRRDPEPRFEEAGRALEKERERSDERQDEEGEQRPDPPSGYAPTRPPRPTASQSASMMSGMLVENIQMRNSAR